MGQVFKLLGALLPPADRLEILLQNDWLLAKNLPLSVRRIGVSACCTCWRAHSQLGLVRMAPSIGQAQIFRPNCCVALKLQTLGVRAVLGPVWRVCSCQLVRLLEIPQNGVRWMLHCRCDLGS